jgi:hypothetical protein
MDSCDSAWKKTCHDLCMKRRRRVLLISAFAVVIIVLAMFTRIGYQRLGWGGYVSIDIAAPWHR